MNEFELLTRERIDDEPSLLAQLERMHVANLLQLTSEHRVKGLLRLLSLGLHVLCLLEYQVRGQLTEQQQAPPDPMLAIPSARRDSLPVRPC
jgi:hypothetical protein